MKYGNASDVNFLGKVMRTKQQIFINKIVIMKILIHIFAVIHEVKKAFSTCASLKFLNISHVLGWWLRFWSTFRWMIYVFCIPLYFCMSNYINKNVNCHIQFAFQSFNVMLPIYYSRNRRAVTFLWKVGNIEDHHVTIFLVICKSCILH